MATDREQDILRLIEHNPLITQQEIADQCGIARGSVAVHISNLMKKGLVKGKGYIMQTTPYIAVVGGVNMDIGGRSDNSLIFRDSNPGVITFSAGGVGRNIAHNLALLGCTVRLVTAFGGDTHGTELAAGCRKAGVDISASPFFHDEQTASYLFITNDRGEMELAVSDMSIYRRITPEFLADRIDIINNACMCVADTNISAASLEYLVKNCVPPLVVDPVSTTKALRIKHLLHFIDTLKCNFAEALVLSGLDVRDDASPRHVAAALLALGVRRIVITMGDRGALCAEGDTFVTSPSYPTTVVNVTGGGDAFTAALSKGLMEGAALLDATRSGLAAGALTVGHVNTIHPDMSAHRIAHICKNQAI